MRHEPKLAYSWSRRAAPLVPFVTTQRLECLIKRVARAFHGHRASQHLLPAKAVT